MYTVFENDKPARYSTSSIWNICSFNNIESARLYAKSWLGEYDCIPENWDGSPIDYSGYGDTISIIKD
jgi:hypothetical protein